MEATEFQKNYTDGILSKNQYWNSDITNDFCQWLTLFIEGNKSLKEIKLDYNGRYNCFNDAIDKYVWGKGKNTEDFETTLNKFRKWRNIINGSDDAEILKACLDILKWGGVEAHNKEKIQRRKNLKEFLNQIKNQLSQQEIIIDDLNPNHINSGYTKIYAALDNTFIIYDGRVGASLCFLIRKYLEEKNISKIPSELIFGWGEGRGDKMRNPSNNVIKFTSITQSRNLHFESNVKANWILQKIAENNNIKISKSANQSERIFALQSALFILGNELPYN